VLVSVDDDVDEVVVVSVVIVDVSLVDDEVDELMIVSVVTVDDVDKILNGHFENEYENDKNGKYFDPFLSMHP
jgi:hypothetical protein